MHEFCSFLFFENTLKMIFVYNSFINYQYNKNMLVHIKIKSIYSCNFFEDFVECQARQKMWLFLGNYSIFQYSQDQFDEWVKTYLK